MSKKPSKGGGNFFRQVSYYERKSISRKSKDIERKLGTSYTSAAPEYYNAVDASAVKVAAKKR